MLLVQIQTRSSSLDFVFFISPRLKNHSPDRAPHFGMRKNKKGGGKNKPCNSQINK
jgi:hypothetical protein